MQSSKKSTIKDRITQAIFTGAVVMLLVFVVSLFLPKEWLVSGKVVVFPSGQPVSASQNLLPETGNTAEIIKGSSFQKANFPDQTANFAGAKVLKNSSMVWVKFRSNETDIQMYEDLIVKIPGQVNDYARDLYSGSPFKYKMAGDPEISLSPVRPNLLLNAILGFLGGVLLYLIYWLGFESRRSEGEEIDTETEEAVVIVSPEIKATEVDKSASPADKVGNGKVEMKDGKPHFTPGEKTETIENKIISPKGQSTAPENLPFVEEQFSPDINMQEPSDDEVKERLNRLMRGEL
ncbi:MAG: hypothetical protein NT093_01905 [Candidatus Moranbacteria bacterium]|nr:hypothetical protein [Candidatus Moranbacteria bacterium]